MKFPKSLQEKISIRKENNALRILKPQSKLIDLASNDYLGFSRNETIFKNVHQLLLDRKLTQNGATGSRLLSGNHELYDETENYISQFHQVEAALIFNSGYDANVGFFSSVPQRNDIILYDEYSHASIRDGIQMSLAKSYKFKHNDVEDLEKRIQKCHIERSRDAEVYIVTESVFSMDGDSPDLKKLIPLSEKYNALLVIDEAHALGVIGTNGEGLVQSLQLQDKVFARIVTFGKALGCHGAAVLSSEELKSYLTNFSRSLIYTTALSPHAIATILIGYQELAKSQSIIQELQENSNFFNKTASNSQLLTSTFSSIKSIVISGNNKVKQMSTLLYEKGFDVKPILSPTVPEGQERLRFCLHAYNSKDEIETILELLKNHL